VYRRCGRFAGHPTRHEAFTSACTRIMYCDAIDPRASLIQMAGTTGTTIEYQFNSMEKFHVWMSPVKLKVAFSSLIVFEFGQAFVLKLQIAEESKIEWARRG
jgi:hypothetical protein